MLPSKVLKTGDKFYFLNTDNTVTGYLLTDICIAIPEATGCYMLGFFATSDAGEETCFPDWIVLDFLHNGIMWREGHEKVAEKIRKIRARQRGEHENNSNDIAVVPATAASTQLG